VITLARFLALVGMLVLAGCGGDNFVASSDALPVDVTWKLVSVGPQGAGHGIEGTYTLRFSQDLTIQGNDACNTCTGTYSIGPQSQIEIRPTCTEKACSPSPSFAYADALGRATSFQSAGDQLVVFYQEVNGATWEMVHVRSK
jgi:heat shock protein HslJ